MRSSHFTFLVFPVLLVAVVQLPGVSLPGLVAVVQPLPRAALPELLPAGPALPELLLKMLADRSWQAGTAG